VAAERGLDLSEHRARRLTAAAVEEADRVFGMDADQLTAVIGLVPEAAPKTELIAGDGIEIPDPHYQSDEFFRDVAARVEEAVTNRAAELVAQTRAIRED
jgi:protein-tyrosine phosphatase